MDTVLSSATPSATDVNSFLSAAEKEALKAATFQRLHPQIYLKRFLEEKIRPDGRSIADDENEDTHAWRNVEVNVGETPIFLLLFQDSRVSIFDCRFTRVDNNCLRVCTRSSRKYDRCMWSQS